MVMVIRRTPKRVDLEIIQEEEEENREDDPLFFVVEQLPDESE